MGALKTALAILPEVKKENKPAPQKTETVKAESKPAAQPKKYDIHEGFGEAKDASEIPADSKAGRAVAYLNAILAGLGCTEIAIKVAEKENAALIELDGEGLGAVIGHRGETLDSVQYLTGLAASNGGGYYKVSINIGNYR